MGRRGLRRSASPCRAAGSGGSRPCARPGPRRGRCSPDRGRCRRRSARPDGQLKASSAAIVDSGVVEMLSSIHSMPPLVGVHRLQAMRERRRDPRAPPGVAAAAAPPPRSPPQPPRHSRRCVARAGGSGRAPRPAASRRWSPSAANRGADPGQLEDPQLVGAVLLLAAVPVGVLAVEVREHGHLRAGREVSDLVARELAHDPCFLRACRADRSRGGRCCPRARSQ